MTDKIPAGTGCDPADLPASCGNPAYVYFSCANVIISGAGTLNSLMPSYNSWNEETKPTPYVAGAEKKLF